MTVDTLATGKDRCGIFVMLERFTELEKKLGKDHIPAKFEAIVIQVKKLIDPIASAMASQKSPPSKWRAPGPWV
jgi:hypothetical protein